jgi:hypothetical protein
MNISTKFNKNIKHNFQSKFLKIKGNLQKELIASISLSQKRYLRYFALIAIISINSSYLSAFADGIFAMDNTEENIVETQHIEISNYDITLKEQEERLDFSSLETPIFKLEVTENEPSVLEDFESEFLQALGRPHDIYVVSVTDRQNDLVLEFNQPVKQREIVLPKDQIKPGIYSLSIKDPNYGSEIKQDFSWGVLAINTDRSIYLSGQTVKLSMAVLDEFGEMVCNAKVQLKIEGPDDFSQILTTDDGSIKINDECLKKELTLIPDYESSFLPGNPGVYNLELTAETVNGKFTISDKIEVKSIVDFDVQRISATRIFPLQFYPVIFTVVPYTNYSGVITEQVPENFLIDELTEEEVEINLVKNIDNGGSVNYLGIKEENGKQIIQWGVKFEAGKEYNFGYAYDAPDKSPDFFNFGPLKVGNFSEARLWQLAVDAPNGNGMLIYDPDGNQLESPHYRTWTPSNLSAENNLLEYAHTTTIEDINHSVVEAGSTTNEYIRGTLSEFGHLNIQRYSGSSWSNATGSNPTISNGDFTTGVGGLNSVFRSFDIAYEDSTGDAIVLYENSSSGDGNLKYRTWNGTSWSDEATLDYTAVDESADVAVWVELQSDVGSDNILAAWHDKANDTILGARWDGDSWENTTQLTASGLAETHGQTFDLAWEATSGDGLVAYGTGTTTAYRTFSTSTGFATAGTNPPNPGEAVNWLNLAGDVDTDYIALIITSSASGTDVGSADALADIWNGTDWTTVAGPTDDSDINSPGLSKGAGVAWEPTGDRALFVYRDGATSETAIRYFLYDISANQFQAIDDNVQCLLTEGAAGTIEAVTSLNVAEDANGPCTFANYLAGNATSIELSPNPANSQIMVQASNESALGLRPELQRWNGDANGSWLTQTANMGAPDTDVSPGTLPLYGFPYKAMDFVFRDSGADSTGMYVYDEDGPNTSSPRYRTWSGTDLASEASLTAKEALADSDEAVHNIIQAAPNRDEYIAGMLTVSGTLVVQVWDGAAWGYGTGAPTNGVFTSSLGITIPGARAFDIAYEDTSGDALVVYEDTSTTNKSLKYRTWNGATWSSESTLDYTSVAEGGANDSGKWIELKHDPGSNNILLGWQDRTGLGIYGSRWDGAAWNNTALINGAGVGNQQTFDVAWEGTSGEGLILYATGTTTDSSTYVAGSGWTDQASSVNQGAAANWISMAGDPNSDYIAAIVVYGNSTTASGVTVDMWNGANWTTVTTPTADTDINTYGFDLGADVAWEQSSADRALFVWRDGTTSETAYRYMVYDISQNQFLAVDDDSVCNLTGTNTNQVITGALSLAENSNGPCTSATGLLPGTISGIKLIPDPSSRKIMILMENETVLDIRPESQLWNGVDTGTWLTQTANMGAPETDASVGELPIATYGNRSYDFTFNKSGNVISISGLCRQYDQTTNCADSQSVRYAVNGTLQGTTGTTSSGSFIINDITAPTTGDIVTVFLDGVADSNEAVAVTKYDGSGSITNVQLYAEHLTIGSVDNQTLSNADIDAYDNSVSADEDIFFEVDGSLDLVVDSTSQSTQEELYILSGNTFRPASGGGSDVSTHDIEIDGTYTADSNALNISGSWNNDNTFNAGTGTVTFTATSGTETIDSTDSSVNAFNDLVLGSGSGTATFNLTTDLDVDDDLTISFGTLGSNSRDITVGGDWTNNATFIEGTRTVTFNGSADATIISGCTTLNSCSAKEFYNLVINKSSSGSTVTLSTNDLEITNTLTLTQGILVQGVQNVRAESSIDSSELIGHWKLDETSSPATDSSTSGNNGTWVGNTTSATAQFGRGALFDGSGDTITIGDFLDRDYNQPITLSSWVKTAVDTGMSIIAKQDNNSPFSGYNLQTGAGGFVYFQLVNTYGSNAIEVRSTNDLNYDDNSWHNITVTYDGSQNASGVKIYYDGTEVPATIVQNTLSASTVNSIPLNIGSRNAASQYFNGTVDDVRIYSRAITSTEVTQLSLTTPTAVSIGASGTWTNTSTGDLILGGGFSNAGTATFQGNGVTCGQADSISITSIDTTDRNWTGAGTFTMNDVTVSDQSSTPTITVYSGTNTSAASNWTFQDCPAVELAVSTTATSIQVDVPTRYRMIMNTNDTDDYILFSDRAENDSSPNTTFEFIGPYIRENATQYMLRWHNLRKTTLLESNSAKVRIRVEGCFDTTTGNECVKDNSNGSNEEQLTISEEYTFNTEGMNVKTEVNFFDEGLALDSSSAEDGFNWLMMDADVTDAAFGGTINYGIGGGAESSTSTDATIEDTVSKYFVFQGTGTYQSGIVSIARNGWFDMTGGTDDWNFDAGNSGALDRLHTRERATTPTGIHYSTWQFLLQPQADLNTEEEREGVYNNYSNPDSLIYNTGSEWVEGTNPAGFNSAENSYTVDASTNLMSVDIDGGSNVSTQINSGGGVSAGATSITVDSTTGFPASGVAYIEGDKFSYTGTTSTTFTGIPSAGSLALLAHVDNDVVSIMNRYDPNFKLRKYRSNTIPASFAKLEGSAIASTEYLLQHKPVTDSYWAQDLVYYNPMESTSSADVGGNLTGDCTFVTAKYGNGIQCDADAEEMSFTNGSEFDLEKGVIDFWMKPLSNSDDSTERFYLRNEGGASFRFYKIFNNTLYFEIVEYGPNTTWRTEISSSNYSWKAHDWVHIRLVWDDAATVGDELRVFINGVEPTHTSDTDDYIADSLSEATTFYLGNNANTSANEECNCVIDEFKLYDSNGTGTNNGLNQIAYGGLTSNTAERLYDTSDDYTFYFAPVDSSGRGEYLYLGSDTKVSGFNIDLETNGATGGSLNLDWEYFNGSTWSNLESVSGFTDGTSNLTTDGTIYWNSDPSGWGKVSNNGSTDLYYIRASLNNTSGTYSTSPVENTIKTDILEWQNHAVISTEDQTFALLDSSPPNTPTSLAQKTTGDVTIATGEWVSATSIKFTATATDPDSSDTLYLCVEALALASSFTNTETGCGSGVAYSGSGVSVSVTLSGLTDATEYHWQARVKDSANQYSSWLSYGGNAESARDFGLDTTAPTGGTVYDGTSAGVDVAFNDGSLSSLSANWSGFSFTVSGILRYEYSIGTTINGTDIRNWTSNTTNTSVTATSLTLRSTQMYYFNVRAIDNANNISTVSSNGQLVSPTLAFTLSSSSINFANLNAGNSYTDTETTTLTVSTNAYNGYIIRMFKDGNLRILSNPSVTIPDFNGGTYASPDAWQGGDYGFGYNSSDTSVQGSNIFNNNPCPGGGTPPCYAPVTSTSPGDIIADHIATVSGSPISNQQNTITYKVQTQSIQEAGKYNTTLVYTIVPSY